MTFLRPKETVIMTSWDILVSFGAYVANEKRFLARRHMLEVGMVLGDRR